MMLKRDPEKKRDVEREVSKSMMSERKRGAISKDITSYIHALLHATEQHDLPPQPPQRHI
eukprot:1158863-Pelagomonas_calceolata.AAC.7